MMSLRSGLRRNRGVLLALGLLAILLAASSPFRKPAPKASWAEPLPILRDGGSGRSVDFAPDGRLALIRDGDSARVRDLTTGRIAVLDLGERSKLSEVGFMEGGRLLMGLLPGGDRPEEILPSIKVWEVPSGREVARFTDIGDGSGWDYVISDDGSALAFMTGPPGPPTIGVWKGSAGWQLRYFPGGGPISLSSDGRSLAVVETIESKSRVVVWDVSSSEILGSIKLDEPDGFGAIALSPDGRLLAENRGDETILWGVPRATKLHILATKYIDEPWFSPDGSLLYTRGISDSTGCEDIWNLGARFPRRPADSGPTVEVWDLAVDPPQQVFHGRVADRSPDGRRVIGADEPTPLNGSWPEVVLKVVELPSERVLGRELETTLFGKAFGPEGRTAVLLIDRMRANWLSNLPGWLPLGVREWGWHRDRAVRVVDVDSGRVLASIRVPDGAVLGRFDLIGDERTLALHYIVSDTGRKGELEESRIELWDVSPRPSPWAAAGLLVVVALVSGRWYDIRARRRSIPAPAPA